MVTVHHSIRITYVLYLACVSLPSLILPFVIHTGVGVELIKFDILQVSNRICSSC